MENYIKNNLAETGLSLLFENLTVFYKQSLSWKKSDN